MGDLLPPHNPEDEAAALGCLFDCESPSLILDQLSIDLFYDQRHRAIYESALIVSKESAVDLVTVSKHLTETKTVRRCGGLDYLQSLPDKKHSTVHFPSWLSALKELALRRAVLSDAGELSLIARDTTQKASTIRNAAARMVKAYSQREAEENPIQATPIGELQTPPENDPSELLKYRFLSIGGGLLINGPTGMGKSSFLMQCLACWANGISAFDIIPTKPLTSILIQAENDDGDIAEMRDGICRGLNLSVSQRANFFSDVRVFTSNGLTGARFCDEVVRSLLNSYHPSIVAIDPALAFLGGDVKEQRDVSDFLRSRLNPLLLEFKCACLIVHHTNKPPSGKEKGEWRNGDMAYLGSGSAEWANWSRASLGLQSQGVPGVYKLIASKRGSRLGWKDENEEKTYQRLIVHSKEKGVICWHWGDEQDLPDRGRPKQWDGTKIVRLLGGGLTTSDWQKAASDETGCPRSTFYRLKEELEKSGRVSQQKVDSKWVIVS